MAKTELARREPETGGEQLVKYETAFDLPFWPFPAARFPVPLELVASGLPAVLSWVGQRVGAWAKKSVSGALGEVVGAAIPLLVGLLGDALGAVPQGIEDLTISISANGRVRVTYHMLEEEEADCDHDDAEPWMNYCPGCGAEMEWEPGANPTCSKCNAPSHDAFNCCWSCGEAFDGEDHAPRSRAKGYDLVFECDNDDCNGKVANLMRYCPWCRSEQEWSFEDEAECNGCDHTVCSDWTYCAFCGENLA